MNQEFDITAPDFWFVQFESIAYTDGVWVPLYSVGQSDYFINQIADPYTYEYTYPANSFWQTYANRPIVSIRIEAQDCWGASCNDPPNISVEGIDSSRYEITHGATFIQYDFTDVVLLSEFVGIHAAIQDTSYSADNHISAFIFTLDVEPPPTSGCQWRHLIRTAETDCGI
jgi:hypothetical protein